MNPIEKVPFGQIDQIARMLEEVAPVMEHLWNGGHHRMTRKETERLAGYLSRIRVSHSRLRDALKAFETLAEKHPVLLGKIINGEIPEEKPIKAIYHAPLPVFELNKENHVK